MKFNNIKAFKTEISMLRGFLCRITHFFQKIEEKGVFLNSSYEASNSPMQKQGKDSTK